MKRYNVNSEMVSTIRVTDVGRSEAKKRVLEAATGELASFCVFPVQGI